MGEEQSWLRMLIVKKYQEALHCFSLSMLLAWAIITILGLDPQKWLLKSLPASFLPLLNSFKESF